MSKVIFVPRLALSCALAVVFGSLSVGTSAAEESFLGGVMTSLGLKSGNEAAIDYRERSPLVIPPKRDLPEPERAAADSNPAWPVDPEVKGKKEADSLEANSSNTFDKEGRPLRPDQMMPGRKLGKNSRVQKGEVRNNPGDNESGRPLRPSELGSTTGLFGMFKSSNTEEEIGKFTSEPPRASLTDPPAGYQTPSPQSPYGLSKDRTPIKPGDYLTEHGTKND